MAPKPAAQFVGEVEARIITGDLDSHLLVINQAISKRVEAGAVEFCWGVRFGDLDVTEENQSPLEVEFVEKETNQRWGTFHPARSATICVAILTAAMVERQGMTRVEAREKLKTVSAAEMLKGVYQYEVERPPSDGNPAAS